MLLGGGINLTLPNGTVLRLHANETNTGFFYALNATHLFGQYGESQFQLSSRDPFVESFDAGQTWAPAPNVCRFVPGFAVQL